MPLAHLDSLEGLLPGRIGYPGSVMHDRSRTVFNVAARSRSPALVIRPLNADQVGIVLRWAADNNERLSVRSGGHSFDGFPVRDGGVLLDLQEICAIRYDERTQHIHVGPGAVIRDIAVPLAKAGRVLPLGECPTVAIGGLVAGGGLGYSGRHLGLAMDALVAVTIVTPDGQCRVANAQQNTDLFWACRGGGGCAGIMTELVFETIALDTLTAITITWRWQAAEEAIHLHSTLMQSAPDKLDLKLKIRTTGADRFLDMSVSGPSDAIPGTPQIHIDGQFLGPLEEARRILLPLLENDNVLTATVHRANYLDAMLELVAIDLLNNPAPPTLRPVRVASDFGAGPVSRDDARALVGFVDYLQNDPDVMGGAVLIEPCNGAIGRIENEASPYAHRNADVLYQWELFTPQPQDALLTARHDHLLEKTRAALGSHVTGGRYLNYADQLDNHVHYWGDNLERLRSIAAQFDPASTLRSRMIP